MGSDLLFSLNTTMPVFLIMVIGYMLGRARILTKEFCKTADWVVFHLALPCMLFLDISKIDLSKEFDGSYVLFCAGATIAAILLLWLLAAAAARPSWARPTSLICTATPAWRRS